ncbi:MAG: hypothetical protein OEQ53_22110, partial [Saprospiraceae bacterium]|nr:hypothetical protein [Saprospiraceae bacterium]
MSISLLLQSLFLFLASPAHDFHLSKTDINYNQQNRSLEITMHVFIDDLELAMAHQGMDSLYLATSKEHKDADAFIWKYLTSVFQITVDGQTIPLNFLGKEESEDLIAIWCYLEKTDVNDLHTISIRNT